MVILDEAAHNAEMLEGFFQLANDLRRFRTVVLQLNFQVAFAIL